MPYTTDSSPTDHRYTADSPLIYHRQSTDIPLTVYRYTADNSPTYRRQFTNIPPVVYRYTTDSSPTVHRHTADSSPRCHPFVHMKNFVHIFPNIVSLSERHSLQQLICNDSWCFSGERCLDHDTNMMALRKVNPHADWIVKPQTQYLHF